LRIVTLITVNLLILVLSSSTPAVCAQPQLLQQDDDQIEDIEELEEFEEHKSEIAVVERAVNVMFPTTVPENSLFFVLDHRNRKPIKDDTFEDFLGFDAGGLKVGLGLRYGVLDDMDAGFYRLNNGFFERFDVYEFDVKYKFLDQADHFVDMAFRSGVTWFYQPDEEDAAGAYEQLLLSRALHERILFGTGVLYHSDSSNPEKSDSDDEYSVAIPFSVEVNVTSHFVVNLEVAANVAGYGSEHPAVSSSAKFIVRGHTFSIVFSNTQYTSADGIVSNSPSGFSDTVLGFSITREFQL